MELIDSSEKRKSPTPHFKSMSGYVPLENTAMTLSSDSYHHPSHLETLNRIDQLFVYKEETADEYLAEVCCGIKPINRYFVTDGAGNKLFGILEDSECCDRHFCAGRHSFTMNVTDVSNQNIIRLMHSSVSCCSSHGLEVQSPPGTAIGYIRQNWHCFLSKFTVENEQGEPAFKIERPFVGCIQCMDHNFELLSFNEAAIDRSLGKIIKTFSCCGSNADYVLRFPHNLDVKMKATVLGACILFDCMYYDTSQRNPIWTNFLK